LEPQKCRVGSALDGFLLLQFCYVQTLLTGEFDRVTAEFEFYVFREKIWEGIFHGAGLEFVNAVIDGATCDEDEGDYYF
jgi:hypothetical protein